MVYDTRSRSTKVVSHDNIASGWVKWTKEWSNKKYEKVKKLKKDNNKRNLNDTLQASAVNEKPMGDGIVTKTDNDGVEELDYEDILSMEEDGLEFIHSSDSEVADLGSDNEDNPESGGHDLNSGKGGNSDAKLTHVETVLQPQLSTSYADDMAQMMSKQSEEQLYNNPVIQKMMQKFFNDQFKNLQQENASGKQQGKLLKIVPKANRTMQNKKVVNNENLIKSPSDTTIYAPVLQKKLTPETGHIFVVPQLQQQMLCRAMVGQNTAGNCVGNEFSDDIGLKDKTSNDVRSKNQRDELNVVTGQAWLIQTRLIRSST